HRVGDDGCVGVADVGGVVDVVDRRRHVEAGHVVPGYWRPALVPEPVAAGPLGLHGAPGRTARMSRPRASTDSLARPTGWDCRGVPTPGGWPAGTAAIVEERR